MNKNNQNTNKNNNHKTLHEENNDLKNKEGKLCFKEKRKTNNNENGYGNNNKEYEWYMIPKFHSDTCHSNYKELKLCFLKNKIRF